MDGSTGHQGDAPASARSELWIAVAIAIVSLSTTIAAWRRSDLGSKTDGGELARRARVDSGATEWHEPAGGDGLVGSGVVHMNWHHRAGHTFHEAQPQTLELPPIWSIILPVLNMELDG